MRQCSIQSVEDSVRECVQGVVKDIIQNCVQDSVQNSFNIVLKTNIFMNLNLTWKVLFIDFFLIKILSCSIFSDKMTNLEASPRQRWSIRNRVDFANTGFVQIDFKQSPSGTSKSSQGHFNKTQTTKSVV